MLHYFTQTLPHFLAYFGSAVALAAAFLALYSFCTPHREFALILPRIADTLWIEPVWKMMWSNKAVLAVLWDMFPGHPNLLPATFDAHKAGKDYVSKPVLAREGANVEVVAGGRVVARSQGNYSRARLVYQERYALRDFGPAGGKGYPVLGAWIVGGEAAGLGIREDGLITANRSRFIPHITED